jgi:hypothetical protein
MPLAQLGTAFFKSIKRPVDQGLSKEEDVCYGPNSLDDCQSHYDAHLLRRVVTEGELRAERSPTQSGSCCLVVGSAVSILPFAVLGFMYQQVLAAMAVPALASDRPDAAPRWAGTVTPHAQPAREWES